MSKEKGESMTNNFFGQICNDCLRRLVEMLVDYISQRSGFQI